MKLMSFILTTVLSFSVFATERSQLDFGLVPYNGQRTLTLTLTNNAEEPLTDISAKIRGPAFYLKHNCPSALNAGESCRAKITFWAIHEGYNTGRLTVETSAKNYIFELIGYADRDPTADIPPPPVPPMPPRP